jgi:UDP-N-acetylmuramoyl-L-alanyl-D-glutamate--2,6-diaminopimelate ligase
MNPKKIVRKILPKSAVKMAEEGYRKSRLGAVHVRYGLPARNLKVIAVTGTNGKTTTCMLINAMLKSAGYKTALFTTAVIEVDGKTKANTSHRTVPLTADLFRFLKQSKTKKVDYVILETTSQALHQHKLWGIPIEIALMTNLTQDHLDYHKTMKNYAAAKARLFNGYMKPKHAIFNRDDEWFKYFYDQAVARDLTYGKDVKSDLKIAESELGANGSTVALSFKDQKIAYSTRLVGEFNVYNSAAAAAVGLVIGLSEKAIIRGLSTLEQVPGRMELVKAGQSFAVVVDYAHAPDALKNALLALKSVTKGRVMLVFGATGNRDKLKRPIMGEIAAKYADKIFLTDDETYDEDGAKIRSEVMGGITKARGEAKTTEIGDRKEAIKTAFGEAKKGDAVLLAGIGHQDYRMMAGRKLPWDEREVAYKLLKK